jgi:hypothetical protein
MGRPNSHGQFRKKTITKPTVRFEPLIFVDHDSDFASIKISSGVEAKSYVKDGFVFCENSKGKIIEIQVLNLSQLTKKVTVRSQSNR